MADIRKKSTLGKFQVTESIPRANCSDRRDTEWTCPEHGWVTVIGSPEGLRCDRCDELVSSPARIARTGQLLKDVGKKGQEKGGEP